MWLADGNRPGFQTIGKIHSRRREKCIEDVFGWKAGTGRYLRGVRGQGQSGMQVSRMSRYRKNPDSSSYLTVVYLGRFWEAALLYVS